MRDTIDMAREAGFMLIAESVEGQSDWWECFDEEIEKLVALVRADEQKKWQEQTAVEIHEAVLDEREACAKIVETPISGEQDDITMQAKDRVAAAIRARSKD